MSIPVHDPFNAIQDEQLPSLRIALDPEIARHEFKRRLSRLSGDGKLRLRAVRVTRHKPGRRCVVEYDLEVERPDIPNQIVTLIGKTRARRSGNEGFRMQESLWNAGFEEATADGVSVPEPIGVISALQMWFQRKVPGTPAEALLRGPAGPAVARRVAEAIHKVHRAKIPAAKQHTMEDELWILRDCLSQVAALRPDWMLRLQRVLRGCERLAANTPWLVPCGIHRDFYSSQIIVDGTRLWLLDFDLYCAGDPGLDVGNFIAHITEQSLREFGDSHALAEVESALEERFLELGGSATRYAVHTYTVLTLARHIFLSTKFPERKHLTGALLSLCEERLEIH
jgi:hypothetical protein